MQHFAAQDEPAPMFAGQVAIVTGAGRGIGRAEALALARHGARVVVNSRSAETTAATAAAIREAGGEAMEAAGDVADDETVCAIVERTVAEFGRLDILVNNAGAGAEFMNRNVEAMPFAHWDRIHATHLRATYVFCHHAIAPMRARGHGRIINTASMHGLGGGRAGIANYTSAKAGVMGLTRNLAKEVGPLGITANAVAPGFIYTEFFDTYPREFIAQIERQNPLHRLGRPDEVADLVCFLASSRAAYINGAIVSIDGGRQEYAIEPVRRAEGGGEGLT
ncbi:MAG TPA: SDR family NAD(P)-dependent oxidoreductase [Caldimonas sp.]|nr:SDR family NAD(P)-dependent oxidoreductase [Caldimonas sp.]